MSRRETPIKTNEVELPRAGPEVMGWHLLLSLLLSLNMVTSAAGTVPGWPLGSYCPSLRCHHWAERGRVIHSLIYSWLSLVPIRVVGPHLRTCPGRAMAKVWRSGWFLQEDMGSSLGKGKIKVWEWVRQRVFGQRLPLFSSQMGFSAK